MIVFVHGVPETAAIWDGVRAAIDAESVALALPGFGCALPERFRTDKDSYVQWLVRQLDGIDGPVDLVGHDWGAALTFRVATAYGDRIRSWVADVANIAHPDYVWHDFAKLWQTPGDGEAFVEAQNSTPPEQRAEQFESMGVPPAGARELSEASDPTMGACILGLYRSAMPNPYSHWGPWSPTPAKGMVLHPTDDPFGDEPMAREVAQMLGARFERLEGAGHFWPYQQPAEAAAALTAFWSSLP